MRYVSFLFLFFLPFLLHPKILTDFKNPDSVLVDEETGYIYVSNINGSPVARDDNGFISRISPDLQTVTLRYLDGALNEFELNAPKGMAIKNGMLYVADIDVIRGFDLKERINVQNIHLSPYGAKYLNDLVFTPDGKLLATDTVYNAIFQIEIGKGIRVKILFHSPLLKNPTGISCSPKGIVYFLSATGSNIWEYCGGTIKKKLGERTYYRYLEDLNLDGEGNIYFTDFLLGKIFRLGKEGRLSTFPGNFYSPTSIYIDSKRKRMFIVESSVNRVQVIDLE